MFIPIRAEIDTRRTPVMNYALIIANISIFILTDGVGGPAGDQIKNYFMLDAARPALWEYLTYQFLHADAFHLIGNMLFLWIFGNAVCDRMGNLLYCLFYVAGGIFAGVAFAQLADNPILGASGAIAAVTTAFLVLFPRVPITMLIIFYFITTFQIQATLLIIFKIILWDNIIAPNVGSGIASNVAYSAHLAGYAFGFSWVLLMLVIGAMPRSQFDMLALFNRWRRRSGLTMAEPVVRQRHVHGRPVRAAEIDSEPLVSFEKLQPIERKREELLDAIDTGDPEKARRLYQQLLALDAEQILPRRHQLELGNLLKQGGHFDDAVHAYAAFEQAYPHAADTPQIRLLLGLLYSRYLQRPDEALRWLERSLEGLTISSQRELAEQEIAVLRGTSS